MSVVVNKVSSTLFNNLTIGAGVLLKNFTPATPATPSDSDIICGTSGGITVSLVPTFKDYGEDIDNCPKNTKELKHVDSYEAKMTFTALDITADMLKMAIGAADASSGKVTPRADLKTDDFESAVYWVGQLANGNIVYAKLLNALSTGGLSIQTQDKGKATMSVELTGHYSISAQDTVPLECGVITVSAGS